MVLKTGRSLGEIVFVDTKTEGDMGKVPAAVREALNSAGGSLPIVALSDATGEKVYGSASHKALVGGLEKALRDAKKAMKEDAKNGTAPKAPAAGTAKKEDEPSSSSGDADTPATADIKVMEKNGAKEVTGAPLEQWTSAKGTSVTARLTKVTGTKVTLTTDKGRVITLGQSELAPASYERMQEILSGK